jgi:hypothetical protein
VGGFVEHVKVDAGHTLFEQFGCLCDTLVDSDLHGFVVIVYGIVELVL